MQPIPHMARVMTPFPHSVDVAASVAHAVQMMEEHGIGHLPVTREGDLVGVVSDGDLRVARALGDEGLRGTSLTVGRICTRDPYVVDITARLDDVAMEMAGRQIGSALVTRNDKLVGILTHTDVCRLLGETLRAHLPSGADSVA